MSTQSLNFNIGPITDTLIQKCANEINKKETKEKILNKIINPLLHDINVRFYKYYMLLLVNLIIIIILLLFFFFF